MSKNTTPAAKPKADIDFENELWNAANELRGAVAENQYKDYVLSPDRYVGSDAEEDDGVHLEEKMKGRILKSAA